MVENPSGSVSSDPPPRRGGWTAAPDLGVWVAWHALMVIGLVLGASHFQFRAPLWALPPEDRVSLAGLVAAYVLVAGTVLWRASRPSGVRFRDMLLAVWTMFGALSFMLLLLESSYSRRVLLAAVAGAVIANSIPFARIRRGFALVLVALQVVGLVALTWLGRTAQRATNRQLLATTFYDVELLVHERVVPSAVWGGGIEPVDGGMLIATGDGGLFFAGDLTTPSKLQVHTLPYRIPVNRQDFVRDTQKRVATEHFRVADLLVHQRSESLEVLVSHHYWNRDRRCYVLRISAATAARDTFVAGTADVRWRTVFDTHPCMSLKADPTQAPFSGDEIGGRMVMLDSDSVLLTVGDMAFDGWSSTERLAQDAGSQYGKTVRVNIRDGSSELYTMGHRNPQGLFLTPEGRLWLTEHGPKGGDELNIVERGKNYGWPQVTLGADYEQFKWPLSATQGRHPGYQAPVYAWLPAIGVSNLIALRGDRFLLWKGDLLIASLAGGRLFRVRVDGERANSWSRCGWASASAI